MSDSTIPTPQQLSDSLGDVGRVFTIEIVGGVTEPDPELGRHVMAMAKRIANRVAADDPRLAAFAAWTDSTGYTWVGEFDDLRPVLAQAMAESWSFERWLSAIAEVFTNRPAPDDDFLDEAAEDGAHMDRAAAAGFRPRAIMPGGGLILTRPGPPVVRKEPLFELGKIYMTPGAETTMREHDIDARTLLRRHVTGDDGNVDDEDKQSNRDALKYGNRVFSAYGRHGDDACLWLITEADRSATTILRPDEY